MQEPLVISHSPCLDGFTAAWAMWLKHPDAEFVPGVYGQDPPDVTGRDVYLLDFSYKFHIMGQLIMQAKSVVVLDHHKSAEADLSRLAEQESTRCTMVFDMEKSGARLAWEWFHPDTPAPLLVRLVEDRDLWCFAVPNSKELNANFFSYPYDFDVWNTLHAEVEDEAGYAALLAGGQAIERKQAKDVKELLGITSTTMKIGGIAAPVANMPYTLASDAANSLAENWAFAATYYIDKDDMCVFSLRSREGCQDVSEVAKVYGGGGHKHAAGFRVKSLEDL